MGSPKPANRGRGQEGGLASLSGVFRDRVSGEEGLLELRASSLETDWEGKVWAGERVGGV